uniref:Uncharacterized protein n=1 Tax=Cacopsylla melanoneura TaxID=428564 RepID=A0A8D9ART6_9HEMI
MENQQGPIYAQTEQNWTSRERFSSSCNYFFSWLLVLFSLEFKVGCYLLVIYNEKVLFHIVDCYSKFSIGSQHDILSAALNGNVNKFKLKYKILILGYSKNFFYIYYLSVDCRPSYN